jgi:hypothetical protein
MEVVFLEKAGVRRCGLSPQGPDECAQGVLLCLDALDKPELNERPGKVMPGVARFEIDIAFQIVGEKSQPELEAYHADGLVYMRIVVVSEEWAGLREIALQDGLAQVGLESNRFPPLGFLSQRVAG